MDVPTPLPVAIPVAATIVATEPVLLVHVPPVGVLLSIVLLPTHIIRLPVIAEGTGCTVMASVATQPLILV